MSLRIIAVSALVITALNTPIRAGENVPAKKEAKPVRLAFVESLFRDSPTGLAKPIVDTFSAMVRAQTGLNTEITSGLKPRELGQKLDDGSLQFGIFQGVEYAWARQKYPELRPLLVIINGGPHRYAALVCRADTKIQSFEDLKGKSVCMPMHSRAHCELFLKRGCGDKPLDQFFTKFTHPANAEDALDDLIDGTEDAVVLDTAALKGYERRKPGRAAKLKVVQKSDAFPPSVVAYRPGQLDDARVKQFREGLLKSQETALGRYLMMLWRMTSFEKVPEDLDKQMDEIIKKYPPPKEETKR
jgi:ABC-type phosphate/phosphonate transport system substrate-binding protein